VMGSTATRQTIVRCGESTLFVGLAPALALTVGTRIPQGFVDLFLASVVASGLRGGKIPGLFAAIAAALALDHFFLPPLHAFLHHDGTRRAFRRQRAEYA
jgi:K+-sensing histidine kinase KdpD